MLYEITVPQFKKALLNLNKILEKAAASAEARKIEMSVFLNARLAPDQFHLLKQVQIVTDTAKLGVARLTGKEAPVHDDKETSLAELKTRIQEVVAYLEGITKDDFKGADERQITTPRWNGKYVTGFEFATQHAIPNLYFHVWPMRPIRSRLFPAPTFQRAPQAS